MRPVRRCPRFEFLRDGCFNNSSFNLGICFDLKYLVSFVHPYRVAVVYILLPLSLFCLSIALIDAFFLLNYDLFLINSISLPKYSHFFLLPSPHVFTLYTLHPHYYLSYPHFIILPPSSSRRLQGEVARFDNTVRGRGSSRPPRRLRLRRRFTAGLWGGTRGREGGASSLVVRTRESSRTHASVSEIVYMYKEMRTQTQTQMYTNMQTHT